MSEKIADILNILDRDENLSQREIAQKTGISLGLVNTLIKKCVKKGLVKIERLNSRNIKYMTPDGIKEKTLKTISYVKRSYRAIQKLQWRIKELAERDSKLGKNIYLLKKDDEIFQLVKGILNDLKIKYIVIDDLKPLDLITKDNSVLCHPAIKKLMVETAVKNKIPYQLEVLEHGGTDAGAIHLSRGGVPSGAISIPCRYVHTPSEMIDSKDLKLAVDLLYHLLTTPWPVVDGLNG